MIIRACGLAGAVLATTALPLAAGPAVSVAAGSARAARDAGGKPATSIKPAARSETVQSHGKPRLVLSVTSVSPSYAKPGHTIRLKGRVWNGGRSALRGLSLQLYSSTNAFTSETELNAFAAGTMPVESRLGAPQTITRLKARHGVSWSIKLPVSALRLTCFGVYPVTVTVGDPTGTLTASDPVPMPFWPAKPSTCQAASRPAPFPVSWIWPLIDSPHQGPCPGLLDNSLAASLAPGGRLDSLLTEGASYTSRARLTWAVDPALLDNARTMTQPYRVGLSSGCAGTSKHAQDKNAQKWIAAVVKATAGQPVFVTPYADVDVAGLAQYGDNGDLKNAFVDGQQLAGPILGRDPVPAALPAGPKKLSAVAWPSGGLPSHGEVANLGAMKIRTVILAMPQSQLFYTPGAVTSVLDDVGTRLKVLLGNNSLSSLLASSKATSRRAGVIFNVSQRFLAETAMIVAEEPAIQRPIVVTPPKRWDPAGRLADDLLRDTVNAPWLKAMTVDQMAAQPEQPYPSRLVQADASGELPGKLLRQVKNLDKSIALLQSIMLRKDRGLSRAVFSIESSSWAGTGAAQAQTMLTRTEQFVTDQFRGLSVGGQRVINVTLGGRAGTVPVSIRNALDYPVRVGLAVTSSNDTVTAKAQRQQFYKVNPHTSSPLKLSVIATQTGKAKVVLRLKSPTGVLLPDPPDKPLVMRIKATNLGTVALVIFAAALAVFVAASAAQAIRRGRPGAAQPEVEVGPTSPSGPAGGATVPETAGAEDAQDSRAGADRTDSVVGDRSELSSVGRSPTKESR
jgi:hypothetical protein